MENDEIDITKLNIIEIKVNNQNEIYMIKSSDKELIRKNKLLCNDLIPYISAPSPSTSPNVSLFTDMKVLLYNPDLSNDEISTFMRNPGKYSFMDEVKISKKMLKENENYIYSSDGKVFDNVNENVIDIVGPKKSFLEEELTVYVIHYQ